MYIVYQKQFFWGTDVWRKQNLPCQIAGEGDACCRYGLVEKNTAHTATNAMRNMLTASTIFVGGLTPY